ncbi:MAG: penicillin acylase family protein [Betaproteobacteria bacterium]|nr:penicillin acylase family protein [Betaproteobacteria bacterium]
MKKTLRILGWLVAALLTLIVVAALGLYFVLRASLPPLDGDLKLAGLKGPVTLTRDARGIVGIEAMDDLDAVRALGYVHAQERFFEMDMARRSAAGELSEILGSATLGMDKDKRRHRMRARLTDLWAKAAPAEKSLVGTYAEGVNAGLQSLGTRPWQYQVLRTTPQPWREIDTLLVGAEMTFMLQGRGIDDRLAEIGLRNMAGDALFAWLKPGGGEWDAALDGSAVANAPLPTARDLDTRAQPEKKTDTAARGIADVETAPGSNNWAAGRAATADGRAILADDMHLGIGVPAIWLRTQITVTAPDGAKRRLAGVTLPGVQSLVVGSNGDVAWGFTNSYGQWFDVVAHPREPAPTGLVKVTETIQVKGAQAVDIEVREAPWGPVLASDKAHDYSVWWTLYREGSINTVSHDLRLARDVDEAVAIAQRSGIPHQNFVVADRAGNIAWTIMGRIPAKGDAPRPTSRGRAVTPDQLPDGWLAPAKYPLIMNPSNGRLWTANSRQTGGAHGALIGDGGFDLGARAMQIRDRMTEKPVLNEKDLYGIQLDAESRFMKRWVTLALRVSGAQSDDKSKALARELAKWNGRADTDQVGYRIARQFRAVVMERLWEAWVAAARRGAPAAATEVQSAARAIKLSHDGRFEYPVWQAISAQAPHLLPLPYKTWDAFLAAQLIDTHDELVKLAGSLEKATWGERNRARFKHPFSRAMPFLGRWLDMPATPQAGDNHLPRVAAPGFGASQRMVVAPGREEEGIFTMPGGQSGHPLSPYFGAGNQEFHEGAAAPLLAGPPQHTLRLAP